MTFIAKAMKHAVLAAFARSKRYKYKLVAESYIVSDAIGTFPGSSPS